MVTLRSAVSMKRWKVWETQFYMDVDVELRGGEKVNPEDWCSDICYMEDPIVHSVKLEVRCMALSP